jgi:exodeoxyribonuclease-3
MKKTFLTIISWNVNGIRATLKKGSFQDFLQKYQPDILCLQETKAEREQVEIDLPEYEEFWNSSTSKKGYSGTAIFTKTKPLGIQFGMTLEGEKENKLSDDQGRDAALEGRVITAEFDTFFVVTVYTPNTKDDLSRLQFRYKKWDPLFLEHVKNLEKKKPVIFCGDLNVAHEEIDLARPKENIGNKGFTNEERAGFTNFVEAGFIDTFRVAHPGENGHYTWWTQWAKARERNVGWRIDYVMVSEILQKNIQKAFILPEVMGSDHCPVGITVELSLIKR